MAKVKNPRMTSPKGVFKFPRLTQPDYKFDADGTYGTKLLLEPEGKGVPEFLKKLDEETDAAFELMKEQNPKHAKKMVRAAAYKMEEDNDGNETGRIEIGFSMKASVVAKQGKNIGKKFEFKPAVFDSFGKPVTADVKIGGGTIGKVSFEFFPYFAANDKKAGLTKRLQAAQIIELVEWLSQGDAKTFGFDDEDEGYSSPTATTSAKDNDDEDADDTEAAGDGKDGSDF